MKKEKEALHGRTRKIAKNLQESEERNSRIRVTYQEKVKELEEKTSLVEEKDSSIAEKARAIEEMTSTIQGLKEQAVATTKTHDQSIATKEQEFENLLAERRREWVAINNKALAEQKALEQKIATMEKRFDTVLLEKRKEWLVKHNKELAQEKEQTKKARETGFTMVKMEQAKTAKVQKELDDEKASLALLKASNTVPASVRSGVMMVAQTIPSAVKHPEPRPTEDATSSAVEQPRQDDSQTESPPLESAGELEQSVGSGTEAENGDGDDNEVGVEAGEAGTPSAQGGK